MPSGRETGEPAAPTSALRARGRRLFDAAPLTEIHARFRQQLAKPDATAAPADTPPHRPHLLNTPLRLLHGTCAHTVVTSILSALIVAVVGLVVVGNARANAAPQFDPFQPRRGFATEIVHNDSSSTLFSPGFAVGFDESDVFMPIGRELRRFDPANSSAHTTLLSIPVGETFGLVSSPIDVFAIHFTEFNASRLHRFDLLQNTLEQGQTPLNTFDVAEDAVTGAIVVNASPAFPTPGASTGVFVVDMAGSAPRRIIQLTGPSGPLAFDPSTGDLVVAVLPNITPAPTGSVRLHRFAAADVHAAIAAAVGTPPLTIADSTASPQGLDGAFDLAFDLAGRGYISNVNAGTVFRTFPGSDAFEPQPFLEPGVDLITTLGFSRFGGNAFEAYLPTSTSTLYVLGVWGSRGAAVHAVRTARPTLTSNPGPDIAPGSFTIESGGLPPSSPAWLIVSVAPPLALETFLPFVPGRPLPYGLDPLAPIFVEATTTDPNGMSSLTFSHVHGGPFDFTLQTLAIDPSQFGLPAAPVSTAPYTLRLTPQ